MEIQTPNKQYHSDNKMIYSCQYHVIFCTKYRRKVLSDNIIKRMKELIIEKQNIYQYSIIELEIMPDHIHLLIDINPKIGIYNVINKIKGYTSRILREEFSELKTKLPSLWTHSKFISTVGAASLETVKKYIEDQKGK